MATGACVSIAMLTWFDYGAIHEWRRSSLLLVQRRADEVADLLVLAFDRDMRAVQSSVLSSPDCDSFMLDPPYDVSNVVASAFARYPYPESFFAWRGSSHPVKLVFFNRSSRPPAWAPHEDTRNRFPVTVLNEPSIARSIVERILVDASNRRRFSISELYFAGVDYQIVARLFYRDQFREQLDGVFGFTVNMPWVHRHYFQELTTQVARISGTAAGLTLALLDDEGHQVAGTRRTMDSAPVSRRS